MRAAIVNPASASGRTATRWRSIVSRLEAGGEPVEVQLTRGPGDAIDIVRRLVRDGCRDLVVLGGDGTIGEVVAGCVRPDGAGMLHDDLVLSVIHQGTGGDLARALGIPKDEGGAIAVALDGTPRRIDVGVVTFTGQDGVDPGVQPLPDGRYVRAFVANSNVGMAAEVVQKVTGRLKKLGNNGAFAMATIGCMSRNRPRTITITTGDGIESRLDVTDIAILNNRFMGGGMLAAPDAKPDDGLLDMLIVSAAGRLRLIRTFPKIYSGRHVQDPLVRIEQLAQVDVGVPEGARAEGVVLDGELVGRTPASWRVLPGALSVRVPEI